jgi:Kef-type K+ transport system membrane component KefB
MENIFFDIGLIIIVATIVGYLAKLLKQPLIPAYILTGLIIGPILGLVEDSNVILTLSEIGIAFLLFVVGLELNLKKLKDVASIAIFGGLMQFILLFISGFLIAIILGFVKTESVYIALIVAFSSTMVVVKILSDKREIDTLHGRIIIGFLLMQDLIAIIALSVLTTLNNFSMGILIIALLKGIILLSVAVIASKFILPGLFRFAAKSQELLFLMALTTCFSFSIFANYIGQIMVYFFGLPFFNNVILGNVLELLKPGFSISIGAFIAGVSIANLPYNVEIIGKMKPLKDFFATIFFVSLGLELLLGEIHTLLVPLIIFTLFVIIFKPLLTILICSLFNYKKRVSFLTSISLAQVSEFSLIIVAQGLILGHISKGLFSLTILLAIITITITSYLIQFDNSLYMKFSGFLQIFERIGTKTKKMEYLPEDKDIEIILCGYNRIGYSIVKTVQKMKKSLLIIDYNPDVIKRLMARKIPCIYGDVGDSEILERVGLDKARMVISTVPEEQDNLLLIKKTRDVNKKGLIFVTANLVDEALTLYDAGADYVILPHLLGGEHVSVLLEDFTGNINKILETKLKHIDELHQRRKLGSEHPMNLNHNA